MLQNRCFAPCAAFVVVLVHTAAGQAPQWCVVPAAYATIDAESYLWVAGGSRDVRQQTLVGGSHLTSLVGRSMTAIELRRTAAAETYLGGNAQLTVTLSTSPSLPLRCSRHFAANVGTDAVLAFQGVAALPTSPPVGGPQVAWTPDNVVRIELQTPFVYQGGTLCIDIVGLAIPGQQANWWMADAVFEDLAGAASEFGDGCGFYGGSQHRWSHVTERALVPGGHAEFFARGTAGGIAVAAFGPRSQSSLPMSLLGLGGVGCELHLASIDAMVVSVFEPETHPALMAGGGLAEVQLHIPDDPAVFGMTLTTQWFDWSQLAVSNAVEWTVAAAMPALDMACVDGHASETFGEVSVHMAHVMRLEHQ